MTSQWFNAVSHFFFLKCSLFPWNLWWFSRCFPIYLALPSGLFCIHIFDASVFLGFHSRSSFFSLHIPHALLPYSPTSLLNLIHSCDFAAICVFSPCSSLDLQASLSNCLLNMSFRPSVSDIQNWIQHFHIPIL